MNSIRVPRIARAYRDLVVERDRSALLGPDRYAVLEGTLAREILNIIDGRRTAADIVRLLDDHQEAEKVWFALMLLEHEGFIEEAHSDDTRVEPVSADARPGAGEQDEARLDPRVDGRVDAGGGGEPERPSPERAPAGGYDRPLEGGRRGSLALRAVLDDAEPSETPLAPIRLRVSPRVGEAAGRLAALLADRAVPSQTLEGRWSPGQGGRPADGGRPAEEAAAVLGFAASYLDPEVFAWAAEARESCQPLLLVCLRESELWIGPEIRFGDGACVSCLREWMRGNFAGDVVRARAAAVRPLDPDAAPRPNPSESRWLDAVARFAGDWMRRPGSPTAAHGQIRVLRDDGAEELHALLRRTDCSECGHQRTYPPAPAFERRRKHARLDGGYRVEAPEATWARLSKHVSPIVGAVRHVTALPTVPRAPVHVYTAAHAYPVAEPGLHTLKTTSRDRAGGKGSTDMQARVSALCEALERYSAVYRGSEPRRLDSLARLGDAAVDPRRILGFSEGQYETRDAWNAGRYGAFQHVPEPFDPGARIAWSPAWSLTYGRSRHVPTSLCYLGYAGPGDRVARADSNGIAAGNCLEEAVLQGFLELVERDAVAIWWYNRTRQPEVGLQRSCDPFVHETRDVYERLGRRLWVLDLTTDLGIPVFAAVSARAGCAPWGDDGGPSHITMGFGAHLDPDIALRRALTEVNQALPLTRLDDEARRRSLLPDHPLALEWWEKASLANHPYLVPAGVHEIDDFEPYESADLLEDVRGCVGRAAAAGLEVLCLDLTRPEVDLHVARVFVPGLRHFWRRLAPGRLYDVPVALGRRLDPARESELNPIPMFL